MSDQECQSDTVEITSTSPKALSAVGSSSGISAERDNIADATLTHQTVADTRLQEPCSKTQKKLESEEEMNNSQRYHRLSKTCCLCWCCCCSCSCLSHVPRQQQGSSSNDKKEADNIPTQEEIVSWGESFDNLIQNPKGRQLFHDFLKYEYSEENLLFWMACEDLKSETDPEVIEEKARVIYEDFISILSPKEVSLDSRVREKVNRNMIEPSLTTFDEAQMQIYTLMHRDSYPRFLSSSLYRNLVKTKSPNQEDSVT